jgi:hypothetical protein
MNEPAAISTSPLASPTDDFCPRQIVFLIPGNPAVQVTATENGGDIDFTVDVQESGKVTADLRALFFHFNEAKLPGLTITGGDGLLTESRVAANNVLDLGDGATLAGAAKPFDVGIEWGTAGGKKDDIYQPVHFKLSDAAHDLTVDDFAHLMFGAKLDSVGGPGGTRNGVAKITGTAPAAPDAHDDTFNIFEDGAAGLNSPSKIPHAVTFNVLANDTDGDGDPLAITSFHDGPSHGSVAIAADGKSILYTPTLDYSGTDSFEYCVSDGHGGQDHALVNVNIAAVADTPQISYSIAQGASINEILVTVTATQTDADSSEFIDRIVASGMPGNVTVTPVIADPLVENDVLTRTFSVVTPAHEDVKFDLNFTATSKETSNGDVEQAVQPVLIEVDFTHNETARTFETQDQSIWDSGPAFAFDKTAFIGVDEPFGIDVLIGEADANLKAGFEFNVHFNAGGIDVSLDMLLVLDTTYNKTTDQLFAEPSYVLKGGSFHTTGPEGSFALNFVLQFDLSYDIDVLVYSDSGSFSEGGSEEIFARSSTDGPYTADILPGIVDIQFEWPHLSTQSDPGTLTSHGGSNNFLQANLDVDALAATFFPLLKALDPDPYDSGNFELLDLDLNAGMNLIQSFAVNVLGMATSTMTLEDGATLNLDFGTPLTLAGVRSHDLNHDGTVGIGVSLAPDASQSLNTAIGINAGADLYILKNIPVLDEDLFHEGISIDIADISVFNSTFHIGGFQSQNWAVVV